ncbi:BTB/POZ domain-containing protein [Rhizophagus clarus]|uniref:BTB/POZ domain-containing protein n=1 Tax=Rhizophagus clarus TaxID=94130 RepID=A0A8H3QQ84_9GLOM|nr:BTB/POZ domain-containing protein [Rhizophagus clarus]
MFDLFIDLDQLDGPDILRLSIAVNEIDIQILTNYIQEYLIINRDNYVQENSIEILGRDLSSLQAPLLDLLFKRTILSPDEIDIWETLIKWCLTQNRNIS